MYMGSHSNWQRRVAVTAQVIISTCLAPLQMLTFSHFSSQWEYNIITKEATPTHHSPPQYKQGHSEHKNKTRQRRIYSIKITKIWLCVSTSDRHRIMDSNSWHLDRLITLKPKCTMHMYVQLIPSPPPKKNPNLFYSVFKRNYNKHIEFILMGSQCLLTFAVKHSSKLIYDASLRHQISTSVV